MRRLLIYVCLAVAGAAIIAAGSCRDGGSDADEDECLIPLPGRNERVVFLRRHIHPGFMAEYSRKVRIEVPGDAPVYCPLPVNVGGRTFIKVYWIDEKDGFGPSLLMTDHWGQYLVDLAKRETLRIVRVEPGRVFAGRVDGEGAGYGWSGSGDNLRVAVGDNVATEITGHRIFDRLQYLGCVDGRSWPLQFVPASEGPKARIRRRLDGVLAQFHGRDERGREVRRLWMSIENRVDAGFVLAAFLLPAWTIWRLRRWYVCLPIGMLTCWGLFVACGFLLLAVDPGYDSIGPGLALFVGWLPAGIYCIIWFGIRKIFSPSWKLPPKSTSLFHPTVGLVVWGAVLTLCVCFPFLDRARYGETHWRSLDYYVLACGPILLLSLAMSIANLWELLARTRSAPSGGAK